jgi:hypothetical protein
MLITINTSGVSYEFPIESQFFKNVAVTPLFFAASFALCACGYATCVQQKRECLSFFRHMEHDQWKKIAIEPIFEPIAITIAIFIIIGMSMSGCIICYLLLLYALVPP